MEDIIKILDEYIPDDNPKKWVKLSSRINYRRLNLLLLKEILLQLKDINSKIANGPTSEPDLKKGGGDTQHGTRGKIIK